MSNINRPSRESSLVDTNDLTQNARVNGENVNAPVVDAAATNPTMPNDVAALYRHIPLVQASGGVLTAEIIAGLLANPESVNLLRSLFAPAAPVAPSIALAGPVLAVQTNFDPNAKVSGRNMVRASWITILIGADFGRAQGIYQTADKTAAYFAALRPVETMQGRFGRKFVGNGKAYVWRGLPMVNAPNNEGLFAAYMSMGEFEAWRVQFPAQYASVQNAPCAGVDGCGVPLTLTDRVCMGIATPEEISANSETEKKEETVTA